MSTSLKLSFTIVIYFLIIFKLENHFPGQKGMVKNYGFYEFRTVRFGLIEY